LQFEEGTEKSNGITRYSHTVEIALIERDS